MFMHTFFFPYIHKRQYKYIFLPPFIIEIACFAFILVNETTEVADEA